MELPGQSEIQIPVGGIIQAVPAETSEGAKRLQLERLGIEVLFARPVIQIYADTGYQIRPLMINPGQLSINTVLDRNR